MESKKDCIRCMKRPSRKDCAYCDWCIEHFYLLTGFRNKKNIYSQERTDLEVELEKSLANVRKIRKRLVEIKYILKDDLLYPLK